MADAYTSYYLRQAEGAQYGGGFSGSQKGDGLGSFLGGLFRRVFPLLKSGAKAFGSEALSTGVGLLKDALTGKSMKESVRSRITDAGTNLTTKAARKMESMVGSGYKRRQRKRKSQSRSVIKRRRTSAAPKRKKRKKQQRKPRRKATRRSKKDIFG